MPPDLCLPLPLAAPRLMLRLVVGGRVGVAAEAVVRRHDVRQLDAGHAGVRRGEGGGGGRLLVLTGVL